MHHYAGMIVEYLQSNSNFGMRIEVAQEEVLLDTGGGLKNAAWFFLEEGRIADEPFLLHNVDVISNIDLDRMMHYHAEQEALATLAVQERASSRYLLFDERGQLCGRRVGRSAQAEEVQDELARPSPYLKPLAFSGIHVISPRLLGKMKEQGVFSIIDAYLHLAARGEKIIAYRADECYWRDLGRSESLIEAARDLESWTD
jgi:NDP-sugar pyrophosphorylase family protein